MRKYGHLSSVLCLFVFVVVNVLILLCVVVTVVVVVICFCFCLVWLCKVLLVMFYLAEASRCDILIG